MLMLRRPFPLRLSRYYSTQSPLSKADVIRDPRWKYQIWTSRSNDPFLNLSIEHHLLQNTPKDSTILFLYVNSPCVVIGRNQNPWLEANLKVVGRNSTGNAGGVIHLVRRRSGGGTVFHDEHNVNYSVICPPADFARDKHAEMVTGAMRMFNPRARVNERHDIVLDQGDLRPKAQWPDGEDMHQTAYFSEEKKPLKVSGSAFKLTKYRALHHGTCLLGSDLHAMGKALRSDARPFLKARGVDSVRSPVGNLFNDGALGEKNAFIKEVICQFKKLYSISNGAEVFHTSCGRPSVKGAVEGHEHLEGPIGEEVLPAVQIGVDEIKSLDWTYRQTPQFILSSHAIDEDNRSRPPLPEGWPASARVYIKVKSGVITESKISISASSETADEEQRHFHQLLCNRVVHEVTDFVDLLKPLPDIPGHENTTVVSSWLNSMFGK